MFLLFLPVARLPPSSSVPLSPPGAASAPLAAGYPAPPRQVLSFLGRVACPIFGHHANLRHLQNMNFLHLKIFFVTIVNELSVLKLFLLSTGDYFFRSVNLE